MTAIICKDLGCLVNYCALLKKSIESDWKNSSDCVNEYGEFQGCMKEEMRRYTYIPAKERPAKYDHIQARIQARKQNNKFRIISGMPSKMQEVIYADDDIDPVI